MIVQYNMPKQPQIQCGRKTESSSDAPDVGTQSDDFNSKFVKSIYVSHDQTLLTCLRKEKKGGGRGEGL